MTTPAQIRVRRKKRQDVTAYAALIAAPAIVPVTLPARGRFRIVATAGATAGDLAATLSGVFQPYEEDTNGTQDQFGNYPIIKGAAADREIRTPDLGNDGYVILDSLERGVTITLESGFELYVDIGLGQWEKIAELSGTPQDSFSSDSFSHDSFSPDAFSGVAA